MYDMIATADCILLPKMRRETHAASLNSDHTHINLNLYVHTYNTVTYTYYEYLAIFGFNCISKERPWSHACWKNSEELSWWAACEEQYAGTGEQAS
jgi:hypothetical protein